MNIQKFVEEVFIKSYNLNGPAFDTHFDPLSLLAAIPSDSPNKAVAVCIPEFVVSYVK